MSVLVFPTLPFGWSVMRSAMWKTRVPESVSGKRTFVKDWSYPRYTWELHYDILRHGSVSGATYTEYDQLIGFFGSRFGRGDSFLYQDQDDNAVTGQPISSGDGVTTLYQMVKSFGGFIEPVLAPNAVSAVRVNSVTLTAGTDYNVTTWGNVFLFGGASSTFAPGSLNFTVAPGLGLSIVADFTYYYPCEFDDDMMTFEKFMQGYYSAKSVKFSSLK